MFGLYQRDKGQLRVFAGLLMPWPFDDAIGQQRRQNSLDQHLGGGIAFAVCLRRAGMDGGAR